MFNASPQSFTSPQAPSTSPAPPQAFSSPQQPSPYPPPASPPQFAPPAPLQGGFFGGMNQPSTPGYNPRPPGMMPAPARAAQDMQGYGRGNDTMLMHVTPGEVQGLQALAQRHGGSLTTNPHTGLPEAGFLEDILPMLAGGLLTMTGIGAPLAALMVGGGTGLATGSLEKGLMAGLGAFGGASLGSALGSMGAGAGAGHAAATTAVNPTLTAAATNAAAPLATTAASAAPAAAAPLATTAASAAPAAGTMGAHTLSGLGQAASAPSQTVASQLVAQGAQNAASAAQPGIMQQLLGQQTGDKVAAFGKDFAEAASGVGPGGKIAPTRTGLAALGASAPFLQAMQPTYEPYKKEDDFNYEGPYLPTQRTPRFRGPNANFGDSSEFSYFDNTNPYPGFGPAPKAFAEGGEVARTEDRALRMPASGYQAGMGAEHNYNFRPVNPAPSMQMGMPAAPARTTGRQSFADMISTSRNKGKGADDASSAPNMRKYRYDPRTQSVLEDGSYSSMGGLGGMGGAGGGGALGGSSLLPYDMNAAPFAAGGDVNLRDGSFVVDARTVSELGNGSSGAGQELLARHGGQPIRGPGDGVSDSIPANIGGRQRAKVARDEVKFDPEAVRRLGGGDLQRGAQKLYALMEKAQKARKAAGRGQDTKLRKKL